jgi:hypothetical protein
LPQGSASFTVNVKTGFVQIKGLDFLVFCIVVLNTKARTHPHSCYLNQNDPNPQFTNFLDHATANVKEEG